MAEGQWSRCSRRCRGQTGTRTDRLFPLRLSPNPSPSKSSHCVGSISPVGLSPYPSPSRSNHWVGSAMNRSSPSALSPYPSPSMSDHCVASSGNLSAPTLGSSVAVTVGGLYRTGRRPRYSRRHSHSFGSSGKVFAVPWSVVAVCRRQCRSSESCVASSGKRIFVGYAVMVAVQSSVRVQCWGIGREVAVLVVTNDVSPVGVVPLCCVDQFGSHFASDYRRLFKASFLSKSNSLSVSKQPNRSMYMFLPLECNHHLRSR